MLAIWRPEPPPEASVCPSPAHAEPPRAAQVNRALGVTRAARRRESSTSPEHGEDGEDAALTVASTVAIFSRDGLTPSQASSCSAAPTLPTGCVSKLAVKRPTVTPRGRRAAALVGATAIVVGNRERRSCT